MSLAFFETRRNMQRLEEGLSRLAPADRAALQEVLDLVWLYHDNALEGEVYTQEELRTATSGEAPTVAEPSAGSLLRAIRAHREAIAWVRREAARRRGPALLTLTRQLHERLTPDPADRPGRYRRNGQVPRAYLHEIADASRISYLLRRAFSWVGSEEATREHPLAVAARVHYEFVRAFPFERNSGRVGRLLLNYMLLREGLTPAVIHAQDRQRYYDAFRAATPEPLVGLIHEAVDNSIDSVLRRLRSRR
jgi:Fic family protein